jgi:hypothetical protein
MLKGMRFAMGERKYFWTIIMALMLLLAPVYTQRSQAVQAPYSDLCHFGVGLALGLSGYDLSILGVGGYLDWGTKRIVSVPANIQYFHVINVSDRAYPSMLRNLPGLIAKNPGATWIIGNEPDSEVRYQDHISTESYAARYYEMANLIRKHDPAARIAFGTIIQPSEIRITYLQKALDHMIKLAGGDRVKALGLIDIYSIHAFILNEEQLYNSQGQNISWGAGLPIGYDPSWGKPEVIRINAEANETWKTHDIEIFKRRVIRFREWMKSQGEQNKPLWITEYGSLFPSTGESYLYVSDQDAVAFMEKSFDFTLGTTDRNLGYPGDNYRLVQHLLWYSLNDYRWHFGGSFYDPVTRTQTLVGERFVSYNPPLSSVPLGQVDVYILPQAPKVTPGGLGSAPGTQNYRILVRAGNHISSDRLTGVQVDLYEGSRFLGSQKGNLPRCGGQAEFAFLDYNLLPGDVRTYRAVISVQPNNGTEINLANQDVTLPSVVMPPVSTLFLPSVRR